MSTQSFVVYDQTHQSHTLIIGQEALLLDGAATAIVALEDNQVTLRSSTETIALSYTALGLAVLGDRPTPSDVGQLLAQYLGRWSAFQALVASLKSFQSCVGQIMTEAQPWLALPLPQYRFDELTRRALEAYDGTEETTRTISRILNQTPEIVTAWVHQIGNSSEASPDLQEASPDQLEAATHRHEEKSAQAVMEPTGTRVRWTAEQEKQLEEDFLTSPTKGVVACLREIAAQRGWPYYAVQAKSYEMKLPQRKRGSVQREAETSPEDHSSEQTTSNEASAG